MPKPRAIVDPGAVAATMLARFARDAHLSTVERQHWASLLVGVRKVVARRPIVYGAAAPGVGLLLDGHGLRHRTLRDGSRQILALYLPGDFVGLGSLALDADTDTVTALGEARVADLPRDALLAAMTAHRGIAEAIWRAIGVEAAIAGEWLLNVGRRDAYARIAHLLCEIALRSAATEPTAATGFAFPMTQNDLADAVAITPVHANRTLQRLRSDGLVTIGSGTARIDDWPALAAAADFTGDYLHLPARSAGARRHDG